MGALTADSSSVGSFQESSKAVPALSGTLDFAQGRDGLVTVGNHPDLQEEGSKRLAVCIKGPGTI
jgi:hypothetical protein